MDSKTPDTPAALRRCTDVDGASAVTLKGDLGILDKRLIGFFCSVRCPGDVILKTYDLARVLRETDVTIVGGFPVTDGKGVPGPAVTRFGVRRGLSGAWAWQHADSKETGRSHWTKDACCSSLFLTMISVVQLQKSQQSVTPMSPLSPTIFSSPMPKGVVKSRSYAWKRLPKGSRCLPWIRRIMLTLLNVELCRSGRATSHR